MVAHFGHAFLDCVYGSIAYLISLIFVDWVRSGRAFVSQSFPRYALAFVLSLAISAVILVILVLLVVIVAGRNR